MDKDYTTTIETTEFLKYYEMYSYISKYGIKAEPGEKIIYPETYHDPYIDIPDNCIIVDDQGKIKVIGDVSSEKEYAVCINRIIDVYTNLKETRAIYYSRYTNDILMMSFNDTNLVSLDSILSDYRSYDLLSVYIKNGETMSLIYHDDELLK